MPHDVPAVTAAIRLIEALAEASPDAVPASRLANQFELNRSTCYNILAALQRGGWVRNLPDRGGWTLGPSLLALAGDTRELFMPAVRDELQALSDDLGLVVILTELDAGGRHLVVAKAEQRTGVRITVGVGDSLPFSAWALMQAVCAFSSASERDRLIGKYGGRAPAELTAADPMVLEKTLDVVRDRGYSLSVNQPHLDLSAVAAPVFDHRGRVWRAVKCLGFSAEINVDNTADIGPKVRSCADRITSLSGGVPPV